MPVALCLLYVLENNMFKERAASPCFSMPLTGKDLHKQICFIAGSGLQDSKVGFFRGRAALSRWEVPAR